MKSNLSRLITIAAFAGTFFLLSAILAYGKPKYMKIFNEDIGTKVDYHDRCNVCHVSRVGGGEKTYFGDAFEDNGRKITLEMRKKYAKFFKTEGDAGSQ